METIINKWREQEADQIDALFSIMEDYTRSDPADSKATQEIEKRVAECIGHNQRGASGDEKLIIKLIEGNIEVSRGKLAKYSYEHIQAMRKNASSKARWWESREVDDIIIHFHMKRVHEARDKDQLAKIMELRRSNPLQAGAITANLIDTLEIDDLGLHIAANKASLIIAAKPNESNEDKIARVEKALQTPTGQFHLPDFLRRRGVSLEINHNGENYEIGEETVKIKATVPDSVVSGAVGKPLHSIIDIDGYKSESMLITGAKKEGDEVILMINRSDKPNRVRLNF